jgi:hypothetical protein
MRIRILDLRTDEVRFIEPTPSEIAMFDVPKGYEVISVGVYPGLDYVSVSVAEIMTPEQIVAYYASKTEKAVNPPCAPTLISTSS